MDFEEIIPERFRCKYDILNDRWFILDTWHPQIKNLPSFNDNIPEECPALKIITGSEMSAIIGEMKKLGYLDKIIKPSDKSGIINKDADDKQSYLLEKMDSLIKLLSAVDTSIGRKREKKPILNG